MKLKVEVADTPYKLSQGLMFRDSLDRDAGMLFVFNRPQILNFWGDNTFIPLDIAFVDKQGRIDKISHIKPMDRKAVSSTNPCLMAVEANYGYFEHFGVSEGDKIKIVNDGYDGPVVEFVVDYGSRVESYLKTSQTDLYSQPQQPQTGIERELMPRNPMRESIQSLQEQIAEREGEQTLKATLEQRNQSHQQNTDLPEIDVDDVSLADDDVQEPQQGDDGMEQPQEPSPEDQKGEEEPTPEIEEGELPPKKEDFGSILAAIDSFGADEGWEMSISYVPKPKPRKIGPVVVAPQLQRVIMPHGHKAALTTHNEIIVSYDVSVGDIRAYISTQVMDWDFTGRKFRKIFRIKP